MLNLKDAALIWQQRRMHPEMAERFSLQGKKIWIAGHTGLVGSALLRNLEQQKCEIMTVSHADLDLTRQNDVEAWMSVHKPDAVILAAARVGGIIANASAPAQFLYENLAIAQNVIHQAHLQGVKKLVFLGSSCIYPRLAEQPIPETALLTGPLEPTNEAYAIAKIAGLKLCQFYRQQYGDDFISVMPCNLYGPGDHWGNAAGHVIPSLMSRIHHAKRQNDPSVTIWGTGTPLREFLYSDDLAKAVILALNEYSDAMPLNIGSGEEVTIAHLAGLIQQVIGYTGALIFDSSKPDGTPRKILESSRIRLMGWHPRTPLVQGLERSYADFVRS